MMLVDERKPSEIAGACLRMIRDLVGKARATKPEDEPSVTNATEGRLQSWLADDERRSVLVQAKGHKFFVHLNAPHDSDGAMGVASDFWDAVEYAFEYVKWANR